MNLKFDDSMVERVARELDRDAFDTPIGCCRKCPQYKRRRKRAMKRARSILDVVGSTYCKRPEKTFRVVRPIMRVDETGTQIEWDIGGMWS